MQVLCKVSTALSDVSCPTCGQGFLVYWTRQRAREREEQHPALQQALRDQHNIPGSGEVHPPAFHVPEAPLTGLHGRSRLFTSSIPVYN